MSEWWDNNYKNVLNIIICALVYIISKDIWIKNHPISLYISTIALCATVFLSFCFVRWIERLILISAYCGISWRLIQIFAAIYKKMGLIDSSGKIMNDSAMYFSMCMWTSLGFEQILPTESARFWVLVESMYGYIFNGITIVLFLRLLTPTMQLINKNP